MSGSYEVFNQVVDHLNINSASFRVVEHEEFGDSEEAARHAGVELNQGAKSLIMKAAGSLVLAIMPAAERLDSKKIRKHLGTSNLRFANPDEVLEAMGCEIGTCHPFGRMIGLETIADLSLMDSDEIACNAGLNNRTIILAVSEYIRLEDPELIDIKL